MWQPKERQVARQGHTTNKINWISINTLSRWSGNEPLIIKIKLQGSTKCDDFLVRLLELCVHAKNLDIDRLGPLVGQAGGICKRAGGKQWLLCPGGLNAHFNSSLFPNGK